MPWLWISYMEIVPILHYLATTLAILIVLLLLRPFILSYFRINLRISLSREQIRLQKKVLEEMQFLRHSAGKKIGKSESSLQVLSEEERSIVSLQEEEPIRINLKKDPS